MQEAIPYLSARPRFSPPGIVDAADERPPSAPGGFSTSPAASSSSSSASLSGGEGAEGMRRLVAENPAVVLARRGCCMGHVARRLLLGLGVNPAVCEIGEEAAAEAEAAALVEGAAEIEVSGGGLRRPLILPVVFVGGRLLGGLDRLLAVHITGELVPILKEAGALWL